MEERRFYLGVDLAMWRDHTALAVVERRIERFRGIEWVRSQEAERVGYFVRHLERLGLGIGYERVVERVRRVKAAAEKEGSCEVVVDATGVGAAVVEMLRKGCGTVTAVVITGGEKERAGRDCLMAPKKDLLGELTAMMERRELRISVRAADRRALEKELLGMKAVRSSAGRERFEATAGGHDDLVMALALACWRARRRKQWGQRREDLGLW